MKSQLQVSVVANNIEVFSLEVLEETFWEWFPHETTWEELCGNNPQLWASLQVIGRRLVQNAKLKPAYLEGT